MQWIVEPTGMLRIGSVLPALIGASAPRQQRCADFQAARGDDVAALAVGVAHQRDVGGAVRVVLDALDLGRDAVLVAHEVDHAVVVLVTTALVTDRDVAVVVAARVLQLRLEQRRFRLALVQVLCTTFTTARRPGEVGLILMTAIYAASPERLSS